ncbi:glycosyltransferase [bacterium]|nr:glycosyltransferase [bacterium]
MKIAIIGSKGIPATYGGVERHVEELATRLVSFGNEVTVYSRKWYTNFDGNKYNGVSIKNIKSIKTKSLDTISYTFLATIDAMKSDFDIIHYQGVGPSLLSFIPKLFSNKKIVSTFHCEDYKHSKWGIIAKMFLKFGERTLCLFSHSIISVSKRLRNKTEFSYNTNSSYIPNGVSDVSEKLNYDILSKFNLSKKEYILAVLRFVRHKGVHYTIDAYNALPAYIRDNFKLVIVGGPDKDPSYYNEIKDKVSDNENIVLTGILNKVELKEIYANAKLFVHASSTEGLPITVLEAMKFGSPVLVSDIPEHLEIIEDGNGFLFENENVEDLRYKLNVLLSEYNNSLLEKVSKKSSKFVVRNYNWDKIANDTFELYKNTLNNKNYAYSLKEYKEYKV